MLRYIFLAVQQWISSDERTPGPLFLDTSDEMRDLIVADALIRILSLVYDRVRDLCATSEQLIIEIIEVTMKEALKLISSGAGLKCES